MSLGLQSWDNVIDAAERHTYFVKKTTEQLYVNKLISQTLSLHLWTISNHHKGRNQYSITLNTIYFINNS